MIAAQLTRRETEILQNGKHPVKNRFCNSYFPKVELFRRRIEILRNLINAFWVDGFFRGGLLFFFSVSCSMGTDVMKV